MQELSIKINHQEKVAGHIDLDKFISLMTGSKMKGFQRAIFKSMVISKNESSWDNPYIANILAAEIDWGAILTSLEWRKKGENIAFRMCPVEYENKVQYKKYQKDGNYTEVVLKEERKSGKDLMVINSFNSNPEHNIDVWLSKSTFPYLEGEWEKIVL